MSFALLNTPSQVAASGWRITFILITGLIRVFDLHAAAISIVALVVIIIFILTAEEMIVPDG
jgi:hypothetical protein